VSAVTFPERLPPNVILMGVIKPARRPRKHLAAVSLTIVTLAVLAAALVSTALAAGAVGDGRRRGNRGPGPFGTCRPGARPRLDLAQRTLVAPTS